jgi:hypothetical protein
MKYDLVCGLKLWCVMGWKQKDKSYVMGVDNYEI